MFGSKILALADKDDRGYDTNLSYESIFPTSKISHAILTDSKGLFDTITTMHEPKKYRLHKTVARVLYSFESGELDGV